MSIRLDRELVERGLARSRGHARELIDAGSVSLPGIPEPKASTLVAAGTQIAVREGSPPWVGRGAYKLVAALASFGSDGLSVEGRRAIDVGASTGGFTQVLLAAGATSVAALDVGHDQLAAAVRNDPRVHDLSGRSVRGVVPQAVGAPFDVLVADLSFISLRLVMADLHGLVWDTGDAVLLVKPQFEVGRERLGKGGIVREPAHRAMALRGVVEAAGAVGWSVHGLDSSPIAGGTGNIEYLLWLSPRRVGAWPDQRVDLRIREISGADAAAGPGDGGGHAQPGPGHVAGCTRP